MAQPTSKTRASVQTIFNKRINLLDKLIKRAESVRTNNTYKNVQRPPQTQDYKEKAIDYHFGRMLHYVIETPDGIQKLIKYVNILNAIIKNE